MTVAASSLGIYRDALYPNDIIFLDKTSLYYSIRAINGDWILLVIDRILQLLIQQVGRRNVTNYTDKKHLISSALGTIQEAWHSVRGHFPLKKVSADNIL